MEPGKGKGIIIPCGYTALVLGFIGLIWGFVYVWYGNFIKTIFRGWLKIIYILMFILFYVGTLLVFVGAAYYFTVWYVLNPASDKAWIPKNEKSLFNF